MPEKIEDEELEDDAPEAMVIAAEIINSSARDRLTQLMIGILIARDKLAEKTPESDYESSILKEQVIVLNGLVMMLKMSIKDYNAAMPSILELCRNAIKFQDVKNDESDKWNDIVNDVDLGETQ